MTSSTGPFRRRWLVVGNLALLALAFPSVARPQGARKPAQSTTPVQASTPEPSRVQSSPPPNRVPASPTYSSSSSSSDGDDDDDGGEAAGKFVGGCCAAFVGAVGEAGANDPSDVESYEPGYPSDPGYAEPLETSASAFDPKAARLALRAASREVSEQCVTADETLTAHRLTVTFSADGSASFARIDPQPESERLTKCAVAAFMRARVAPFEGASTQVSMALDDLAPAASKSDAGLAGTGGAAAAAPPTTGSEAR